MDGQIIPDIPLMPDGSTNQNPSDISLWNLIKEDF